MSVSIFSGIDFSSAANVENAIKANLPQGADYKVEYKRVDHQFSGGQVKEINVDKICLYVNWAARVREGIGAFFSAMGARNEDLAAIVDEHEVKNYLLDQYKQSDAGERQLQITYKKALEINIYFHHASGSREVRIADGSFVVSSYYRGQRIRSLFISDYTKKLEKAKDAANLWKIYTRDRDTLDYLSQRTTITDRNQPRTNAADNAKRVQMIAQLQVSVESHFEILHKILEITYDREMSAEACEKKLRDTLVVLITEIFNNKDEVSKLPMVDSELLNAFLE
jgi:hypothetical protein